MSVALTYLILGTGWGQIHTLDVPIGATSLTIRAKLKETLPMERNPIPLGYIGQHTILVRLVNFSFATYRSDLANFDLKKYPAMYPSENLSSLFSTGQPPADSLHLIVTVPAMRVRLYCAFEAEEITLGSIFSVEICFEDTIADLRKLILETKKSVLGHVDSAEQLDLYKVRVTPNPDSPNEKLEVDLARLNPLDQCLSVIYYFCNVNPENEVRLDIVVQVLARSVGQLAKQAKDGRKSTSDLKKRYEKAILNIAEAPTRAELFPCPIYDGRYQESNPRTTVAPPVELFHPVFGHFLDDLKSTNDIPEDIVRLTKDYMASSSAIYASQYQRRAELTPILSEILCVDKRTLMHDGILELRLPEGPTFILLKEDQNEHGDGDSDPSTRAGFSLCRTLIQRKFKRFRDATCCPTFVVATAGPWIVILGAVFTDGLILQPLTDYLHVGVASVLNGKRIYDIARVFYALKTGLQRLKSYYEAIDPSPNVISSSRYFPSITAYRKDEELVHFKYVGYLEDGSDCTTLRAQTSTAPPRDIVVKFVDRYGEKPHRLLAENGLAPELIYYGSPGLDDKTQPTYNALSMVVMEFIDGQALAQSKLNKKEAERVQGKLKDALKLLHDNGYVFGDLRAPNVMITTGTQEVKIIDFDWAGKEGQVRYPHFLSPVLRWPDGVTRLAAIEKRHDMEMLKTMFTEPVPFITSKPIQIKF